MVRIVNKDGGAFHEPPYTWQEQQEFYRRIGGGPKVVLHAPALPRVLQNRSPQNRGAGRRQNNDPRRCAQLAWCCDSTVRLAETRRLRVDPGGYRGGVRADFQNR